MHKPRPRLRKKQVEAEKPVDGDLIAPGEPSPEGISPALYAAIIAQITNYTERPDLLIEVIEKHDPGFIRSMNEESKAFAKKSRQSKFNFGRFQAYVSVAVQVAAALGALYIMYVLAEHDRLNFGLLIGLAVFFAVSQSGMSGFIRIANQIGKIFGPDRPKGKK